MFLLKLIITLLLYKVSLISAEITNPDKMCHFRNTVDLGNLKPNDNGSYVYQDILIPIEKLDFYDYHLGFQQQKISVSSHLRGCVCGKEKPCMKLCCEKTKFFNETSHKCQKFAENSKVSWDLDIRLKNDSDKRVNIFEHYIYQVGLPCQIPEPFNDSRDKWNLLEGGDLYVGNDDSIVDTIDYCFTPYKFDGAEEYSLIPQSCSVLNVASPYMKINNYAMIVSILFLIPTIVVYLIIKELRRNLRGKLLISYLVSLIMAYGFLTFINLSELVLEYLTCAFIGYSAYFFTMSAFLWLSVLCFDIWHNFKETNVHLSVPKNLKRFILYSLYAWGVPSICCLLVIWADLSPYVPDEYKPGINEEMCWLETTRWSALIYLYGPNLIILMFNCITFGHITMRIYKVRRDMAKMSNKEKFFHENAVVILRLFLIMGISWLFDILSYFMRNYKYSVIIFSLSDFANAIQGLLIFCLFVLKRNVQNWLKERFSGDKSSKPGKSQIFSSTNSSKLQTSLSVQTTTPLMATETP